MTRDKNRRCFFNRHSYVRGAVPNVVGIVRIAMLARAGIHIGETTDGRILKEKPGNAPDPTDDDSIAVIERFHRTMKEILRLIIVPEDQSHFEREVECIIDWYNEARPHMALNDKTPNEVYSREPANEQPRIESRKDWPRGSPCAKPQVEIDGAPGDPMIVEIDCHECRRHLPIIRARHAA